MAEMYRGLSHDRAKAIVAGREQIAATSNGEFGTGSYYWKNDLPAAVISAVQYYGQQENGWAVLRITVGQGQMANVQRGAILNFRDPGTSRGFDPATMTAPRAVTVPGGDLASPGGDVQVRMSFSEFREINADPEGHSMTGQKNHLAWANYSVIAGPTAAAPKDVNLTQVKFSGDGLTALNAAPKAIVMHGPKLNDSTFQTVRSWKLENRNSIFQKYFVGRTEVALSL